MTLRDKAVIFAATGGYVGMIPAAPGTFGSLVALPLCYLLSVIGMGPAAAIIAILLAGGVWICQKAEALLGKKDPGCIVIDEIAGMALCLAGHPFSAVTVASGFAIFRLLDIAKPWPVGALDRKISGGLGVMMDDVAAGIMANLILHAAIALIGC